jgi:hypothetical protein
MPKWVGFDMDECIGSVMPLYAFVKHLPAEALINALLASEAARSTWLIRPATYYAVDILYRAWINGKVYGAFIFSNNGSQDLVNFVADYLNTYMARRYGVREAKVFKMGVCRGSPARTPGSLDKSFSEVQRALSAYGLPLLTSERDLLFFDDMVHVLTGEIRDYVQVRPYYNHCPIERVIVALMPCESAVGKESWDKIIAKARHYEKTESGGLNKTTPPTPAENIQDRYIFSQAFRRFLGHDYPSQRAGKTRRHRPRARKNTLRLK